MRARFDSQFGRGWQQSRRWLASPSLRSTEVYVSAVSTMLELPSMTPSAAEHAWAAWTPKHGDPTRGYLGLAEELGVLKIDGETATSHTDSRHLEVSAPVPLENRIRPVTCRSSVR
jgi:hypothetical protein